MDFLAVKIIATNVPLAFNYLFFYFYFFKGITEPKGDYMFPILSIFPVRSFRQDILFTQI